MNVINELCHLEKDWLNYLSKNQRTVHIYFTNGVKLVGNIQGFDVDCFELMRNDGSGDVSIVFKKNITTITLLGGRNERENF